MKNKFKFLATMLIGILLSVNVWGIEVTITLADGTATGSGAETVISWTASNIITISQSRGTTPSKETQTNPNSSYIASPRWYKYNNITFTPLNGSNITSVVIEQDKDYANLKNGDYTNASSSTSGTTETITPTDGTQEFSVWMDGGQSRVTSITVNYVSSATYNVTWKVNNAPVSGGSTSVPGGGKVSALPTAPTPTGGCTGSTFMGWTASTTTNFGSTPPDDLFKDVEHAPAVTEDVTYHAVFADESE